MDADTGLCADFKVITEITDNSLIGGFMKMRSFIALFLSFCCVSLTVFPLPLIKAQESETERFSAMGYLPSGVGKGMVGAGRTFSVDIYIEKYSPDEDAKTLEEALLSGGSNAVLKSLEKMKSIGKITLTGRVGFYDLKFIRSRQVEGGRRVIAVTDRPISGLEAFYGSRSEDYNFGIMELDLKPHKKGNKEKGEGTLIYAAKVKLIKGNTVEIENYGISPVQLRGVKEL